MPWSFSGCAIRGSLILVVLSACGRDSDSNGGHDDAVVERDASLTPENCVDNASDISECRVARTILSCELAGGGGAVCLSDDPEGTCEGADADTCEPKCEAQELGVVCGRIGPSMSQTEPPAGCRMVLQTPGGTASYCCPCSAKAGCPHEDACRRACLRGNSTWGNSDALDVCDSAGFSVDDCVASCCAATPALTTECAECLSVTWDGGCSDGPDGGFGECTCVGTTVVIANRAECGSCRIEELPE